MKTDFTQDDGVLDVLSQIRIGPVTLRRAFLLMTRVHFSDSGHYGPFAATLGKFVWHKDPSIRKLHIDFDFNYDPNKTDWFPAIFVGIDNIQFQKAVQDNRRGSTEDRAGETSVLNGSTNIIIRHISTTPDEALQLCELSFDFFLGMRRLLIERMNLRSFEIGQISSTRPLLREGNTSDKQFVCDLIMPISFNVAWTTFRESHRIKTVSYKESLANYSPNP